MVGTHPQPPASQPIATPLVPGLLVVLIAVLAWVNPVMAEGSTDAPPLHRSDVDASRIEPLALVGTPTDSLMAATGAGWRWEQATYLPEAYRRDHARFGSAADTDGERLILGAPGADGNHLNGGAAFVYRRAPGGGWELEASLFPTARYAAHRTEFGVAVAIDGDLAIVGAPWKRDADGDPVARAHLFKRSGVESSWTEVCWLGGTGASGGLGLDVDVSGSIAVVGDRYRDTANAARGGVVRVVEFHAGESSPCRFSTIQPESPHDDLQFGSAVAVDGDVVAIGAPGGPLLGNRGFVGVYRRSVGGWNLEKTVRDWSSYGEGSETTLVLFGDNLLVGSSRKVILYRKDEGGLGEWGSVRAFERDPLPPLSEFGSVIAMVDHTIVIGDPGFDPSGGGTSPDHGMATIYKRWTDSYTAWIAEATFGPPAGTSGARFGSAIAAADEFAVIGSPHSDAIDEESGLAAGFVEDLDHTPRWVVEGAVPFPVGRTARGGFFGASVEFDEHRMVIGQPGENTVHLYVRDDTSDSGWRHESSLAFHDDAGVEIEGAGTSVAIDDDVLVVGLPTAGSQAYASGVAYVVGRGDEGWRIVGVLEPTRPRDFLGFGVDVAVSDSVIAVAAEDAAVSSSDAVAVHVFEAFEPDNSSWVRTAELGSPEHLGPPGHWTTVDVDGDTIVACDHSLDGPTMDVGACDVFERSSAGFDWEFRQRLTPSSSESGMTFGYDVAVERDTILVGVPYFELSSARRRAKVLVFNRADDGLWRETGTIGQPNGVIFDHVGTSIAVDGNLAVLGVPGGGDPRGSGTVLVYRRLGSDWELISALSDTALEAGLGFGSSVATNGREVLVGIPNDRTRGYDAGAVTVFYRQESRLPFSRRYP